MPVLLQLNNFSFHIASLQEPRGAETFSLFAPKLAVSIIRALAVSSSDSTDRTRSRPMTNAPPEPQTAWWKWCGERASRGASSAFPVLVFAVANCVFLNNTSSCFCVVLGRALLPYFTI